MFQVIYLSEVILPVPEHRLARLLERSRASNRLKGISGLLLRDGSSLLHVIEGPRGEVEDLMARIGSDRRHSEIRVLWSGAVLGREFDQTPLAYVDTAQRKTLPAEYLPLRVKIRNRTITRHEARQVLGLFSSATLDHLAAVVIDNPGHAGQPAT